MHESILGFGGQLSFMPKILDGVPLSGRRIIFSGMGGSHLAGGLYRLAEPHTDIRIHSYYGLPELSHDELADSVLIASSYSGNTEETLDFLSSALRDGLRPGVITTGGKLLSVAEHERLPRIILPKTVIQPRVAVGLSLVSLATLVGNTPLVSELSRIAESFDAGALEMEGKHIAERLNGFVPLVYASAPYSTVAYNWKIKINETAKIPAFCHDLSEANHNEMAGFALADKGPTAPFKALFLTHTDDHPRIRARIDAFKALLSEHGVSSEEFVATGDSRIERALRSLVTADWASYHLARAYGTNPDDNPIVEEFKKRIA